MSEGWVRHLTGDSGLTSMAGVQWDPLQDTFSAEVARDADLDGGRFERIELQNKRLGLIA